MGVAANWCALIRDRSGSGGGAIRFARPSPRTNCPISLVNQPHDIKLAIAKVAASLDLPPV